MAPSTNWPYTMYRPSTTRQCMQTEEGMKVELRYDSRFGKKNTPGARTLTLPPPSATVSTGYKSERIG